MSKLFLLALCLIASCYGVVRVQVEPKSQECFWTEANAGERVKIPFFVERGGLLDIDLRVSFVQSSV